MSTLLTVFRNIDKSYNLWQSLIRSLKKEVTLMKRVYPKRIKGMLGSEEFFRNSVEEYNRLKRMQVEVSNPNKAINVWVSLFHELQSMEIFIFHDNRVRRAASLQTFSRRGLNLSNIKKRLEKDRKRMVRFLKSAKKDFPLSRLEEESVRKSLMIKAKVEKVIREQAD